MLWVSMWRGGEHMFARLATFAILDPTELDQDALERRRRIIRSTPSYHGGFHVRDSKTARHSRLWSVKAVRRSRRRALASPNAATTSG